MTQLDHYFSDLPTYTPTCRVCVCVGCRAAQRLMGSGSHAHCNEGQRFVGWLERRFDAAHLPWLQMLQTSTLSFTKDKSITHTVELQMERIAHKHCVLLDAR